MGAFRLNAHQSLAYVEEIQFNVAVVFLRQKAVHLFSLHQISLDEVEVLHECEFIVNPFSSQGRYTPTFEKRPYFVKANFFSKLSG